jgi:Predicted nucleotide-binding protein containing TIR-like domain
LKPHIFIGSSVEGLPVAQAIQQNLDHSAFCTIWHQGVFGLSGTTIDSLAGAVRDNDFSIFVFSPDDIAQVRSKTVAVARDNVILEAGLFIGRYGKGRNFIVAPRGTPGFHIPTDLLGITLGNYDPSYLSVNAQAALGTFSTQVMTAVSRDPSFNRALDITPVPARGGASFPLKLLLDVWNRTAVAAVLTSDYFAMGPKLRPHQNARGKVAQNRYEVKLPDSRGLLSAFQYLLLPNTKVETWMPIDPVHTDVELQDAIRSGSVGEWHYSVQWLDDGHPFTRSFVAPF